MFFPIDIMRFLPEPGQLPLFAACIGIICSVCFCGYLPLFAACIGIICSVFFGGCPMLSSHQTLDNLRVTWCLRFSSCFSCDIAAALVQQRVSIRSNFRIRRRPMVSGSTVSVPHHFVYAILT